MATKKGARGARGIPGPAGPPGPSGVSGARGVKGERGARGSTGTTGATGARGERGLKGGAGAARTPPPTLDQLNDIERTVEAIYQELDIQMKRMSQIQLQLDEVRGKVKLLTGNLN